MTDAAPYVNSTTKQPSGSATRATKQLHDNLFLAKACLIRDAVDRGAFVAFAGDYNVRRVQQLGATEGSTFYSCFFSC